MTKFLLNKSQKLITKLKRKVQSEKERNIISEMREAQRTTRNVNRESLTDLKSAFLKVVLK